MDGKVEDSILSRDINCRHSSSEQVATTCFQISDTLSFESRTWLRAADRLSRKVSSRGDKVECDRFLWGLVEASLSCTEGSGVGRDILEPFTLKSIVLNMIELTTLALEDGGTLTVRLAAVIHELRLCIAGAPACGRGVG